MLLQIRPANAGDFSALHPLVQRAYRGDTARAGWTHEADLLDDERISMDELARIVASPAENLLIGYAGDAMIGCVRVAKLDDRRAYLGLLCVDPQRQAGGYGKQLISAAEATARDVFHAVTIEMTVIDSRRELIAYYYRRGYEQTGTCDFPVKVNPPLHMVVLTKALN